MYVCIYVCMYVCMYICTKTNINAILHKIREVNHTKTLENCDAC